MCQVLYYLTGDKISMILLAEMYLANKLMKTFYKELELTMIQH